MYDEEYNNNFGMKDDGLLYCVTNLEDTLHIGPSEDNFLYDSDEIYVDDFADCD